MSDQWEKMAGEFTKLFADELGKVVTGAQEDLVHFAQQMATDMTEALALGDVALANEIKAQAQSLAEANRLRAVDGNWNVVTGVIGLTMKAAFIALGTVA